MTLLEPDAARGREDGLGLRARGAGRGRVLGLEIEIEIGACGIDTLR